MLAQLFELFSGLMSLVLVSGKELGTFIPELTIKTDYSLNINSESIFIYFVLN